MDKNKAKPSPTKGRSTVHSPQVSVRRPHLSGPSKFSVFIIFMFYWGLFSPSCRSRSSLVEIPLDLGLGAVPCRFGRKSRLTSFFYFIISIIPGICFCGRRKRKRPRDPGPRFLTILTTSSSSRTALSPPSRLFWPRERGFFR